MSRVGRQICRRTSDGAHTRRTWNTLYSGTKYNQLNTIQTIDILCTRLGSGSVRPASGRRGRHMPGAMSAFATDHTYPARSVGPVRRWRSCRHSSRKKNSIFNSGLRSAWLWAWLRLSGNGSALFEDWLGSKHGSTVGDLLGLTRGGA